MARQRMNFTNEKMTEFLEGVQDFVMSPQLNNSSRDNIKRILESVDVIDVNDPKITGFVLAAQTGAATIDDEEGTIEIEVAAETDVKTLTPTLTIPSGCTSSLTGVQDFTDPVVYTITNQDGDEKSYTVTVTIAV